MDDVFPSEQALQEWYERHEHERAREEAEWLALLEKEQEAHHD